MRYLLLTAALLGSAMPLRAEEITVFAAASLKDALDQIAANWQADTGNVALMSYDSSAKLAKQIEAGAPADLFFSAAENWMDVLGDAGLLATGSRKDVLGNTLVLVGHGPDAAPVEISQGMDIVGLLAGGKLAMGLVDSVPAGQYGKEALENLGLWESVAGQVAETENVRAALALVATGEAGFGIVYGSDAVADDLGRNEVSVVGSFPADSHGAITYPLALTARAKPAAADFMAYLQGEAADAVFADLGFAVLP